MTTDPTPTPLTEEEQNAPTPTPEVEPTPPTVVPDDDSSNGLEGEDGDEPEADDAEEEDPTTEARIAGAFACPNRYCAQGAVFDQPGSCAACGALLVEAE